MPRVRVFRAGEDLLLGVVGDLGSVAEVRGSVEAGAVARGVLGAGAVVGEKQDQGVVELVVLFQLFDDAPDALIEAVDHGGVNGHGAGVPDFVGIVFPAPFPFVAFREDGGFGFE